MDTKMSTPIRKSQDKQDRRSDASRKSSSADKTSFAKNHSNKRRPKKSSKKADKKPVDWDDQTWASSCLRNYPDDHLTSIDDQVLQFRDLDNQQDLQERQPPASHGEERPLAPLEEKRLDLYYYDDDSAFTVLIKDSKHANIMKKSNYQGRDEHQKEIVHHLRNLKRETHQKHQATKIRITDMPHELSFGSMKTVPHQNDKAQKFNEDMSVYTVGNISQYIWTDTQRSSIPKEYFQDDLDETLAATTFHQSSKTVVGATFFRRSIAEFICGSLDLGLEGEETNYKEDIHGLYWNNQQ